MASVDVISLPGGVAVCVAIASLPGGGNCLRGESLDSQDRHDGGVFDVVPLLRALCWETGGPLMHSSGVRDCPDRSPQALCTVVAGLSKEAGVAVLRR